MLPESLPSTRGPGVATPASLLPSVIAPHLRSLSSTGITRRHQSYGPLRHPDRPGLPLAGVRLARATPPTGLPVLRPFPSCMHAAATTPAEPAGARVRSLPSRWQPSPNRRRVGFRVSCFEACAAFTPVAACMLAEPPKAALLVEVLQAISLPPSPAPTATGWSDSCRAGFAPAEKWRLGMAHSHQYLTAIVIIEPSPNALLPDTDFRILALEKIHRHMPNHSEIMWCISATNPALVFSKRHVQSPMQSILYPPMGTHRLVKRLHVIKRSDVVASFPAHLPFGMTFRLHHPDRFQSGPSFADRQMTQIGGQKIAPVLNPTMTLVRVSSLSISGHSKSSPSAASKYPRSSRANCSWLSFTAKT